MEQLLSLKEDEKLMLTEVTTVVTDGDDVNIQVVSLEFFENEFPDRVVELDEIIRQSLDYAGYFDYVETNVTIGFLELHAMPSKNMERPLKVGMYLEVQDKDFYKTDLPDRIRHFLSVLNTDINNRYWKQ